MKKNKGITIIGLILTIIIMLILIGVVIQILINGKIFEDAEKAGNKYITSSGDEASNTTVTIGGKQYDSIDDYFGSNKKIKVTIKLHDEINGVDAGTGTAVYGNTNIGIVARNNAATGKIENCHVSGPIKSSSNTGGGGAIAGSNSGTIYNCSAKSAVTGYFWTGGIAGKNFGTIEQTFFVGNVNGSLTDNQVSNKQAKYIGGIAGGTTGVIKDSYSICTGDVKGYAGVGGIAGWYKNATVTNSYCAGTDNVYGAQYVNDDLGYTPGGTSSISGVYTFATTTKTGLTSIPSEFNSNIWNMNGHTYSSCPNLVNNAN